MKIIERTYVREAPFSAAVMMWNHFDHEHLTVVHSGYTEAQILSESPHTVVSVITYKLPVFSFLRARSISTIVRTGEYSFQDFKMSLFGVPSIVSIDIEPKGKDMSRYTVKYQFILHGWRKLLAPIMYRMMDIWNERVWNEDLPLKIRRQLALRNGFKDFVGMPAKLADRRNDAPLRVKLPLARPPACPLDVALDIWRPDPEAPSGSGAGNAEAIGDAADEVEMGVHRCAEAHAHRRDRHVGAAGGAPFFGRRDGVVLGHRDQGHERVSERVVGPTVPGARGVHGVLDLNADIDRTGGDEPVRQPTRPLDPLRREATDPDRDLATRRRVQPHALCPLEAPVVGDQLAAPQLPQQLDLLGATDPPRGEVDAERPALNVVPPESDAQNEPTVAEQIDVGSLTGDEWGLSLRQDQHAAHQMDAVGDPSQVGEHHERIGERILIRVRALELPIAVRVIDPQHVVVDEEMVEAPLLDRPGDRADRADVALDLGLGINDADLHIGSIFI